MSLFYGTTSKNILSSNGATMHTCSSVDNISNVINGSSDVNNSSSSSNGSPGRLGDSLGNSNDRRIQRVFSRTNFPAQLNAVSWDNIIKEAKLLVARDEFMASVVNEKILKHPSFVDAIVESLSLAFHTSTIPSAQWSKLFSSVYHDNIVYDDADMLTAEQLGLLDLGAVRERDPASGGLINPLLFFKGYKSIQAHRIAHVLWNNGRTDVARAIQSRCSEIFSVDIHPAARIGAGLMIDHGTGVVIGETAVIGTNCSFLHGVTLGSTGKERGDRHPKLGNDILIGCNSTVLGNICIGSNTKIGSGSIVLKSLPCCVTAVGNPARIVGRSKCSSAANNMDLALHNVHYCLDMSQMVQPDGTVSQHLHMDADQVFSQVDKTGQGTLSRDEVATAMGLRFGICPPPNVLLALFNSADINQSTDGNPTGRVNKAGYCEISVQLITFTAVMPQNATYLKEWETYVASASSVCKLLLAKARLEIEMNRDGAEKKGAAAANGASIDGNTAAGL